MDNNEKKEQLLFERSWNDSLLASDPMWRRLSFTSRIYVQQDQDLVLWEYHDGKAFPLALLTVTGFGLSADQGPTLTLQQITHRHPYIISTLPYAVIEGIYLWIPSFAGIRYTPRDYKDAASPRRLTVPLCIRTLHRPHQPVNGARFLTSLTEFRKAWPDVT